ncbi:hypothetical protein DMENIID0001_162040 [Sergentomyia squamirostris]
MKPVCIVCSFRPLIVLGRCLGFSPISLTCSTAAESCSFAPSMVGILISLVLNVFLSAIMVGSVVTLAPDWILERFNYTTSNTISKVFSAIEFIQVFIASMLLCLNVLQCRQRARALGKIARYLHHTGPGVERSITERDEKLLFWMSTRQACIIFFLLFGNILYVYLMWPHQEEQWHYWIIIRDFGYGISSLPVLMVGFEVSLVMTLFRLIAWNLDKQLRKILYSASQREEIIKEDSVSIFHRIVRIRRSHGKIIEALMEFNKSVNPQLAFLTCLVMISTVLNCYIAGQYAFNSTQTTIKFISTCLRLLMNVTIVLYMIYKADQVLQMNELTFRLVTSVSTISLSLDELMQLEVLSRQLTKNPPLFSASGIFAFNASIVAKMFSTVITYIIVALQFDIRIFRESIEAVSR